MSKEKHEEFVRTLLRRAWRAGTTDQDEDKVVESLLKEYVAHRGAQATEAWCDLT